MTKGKEKLKPCAKCGGEPYLYYRGLMRRWQWGVECEKCGHAAVSEKSFKDAIKAWNRRTP